MSGSAQKHQFSRQLETWLNAKEAKTLEGLTEVFADKSFAIAYLILMFPAALPLPTGGITHVFEIVTMLLALESIGGRSSVWLPNRWRNLKLGPAVERKAIPFIIKRVRWFEKYSKPRLSRIISHRQFMRIASTAVFLFALGAFLAPPFSGLDTLPALAAVMVALALILEDAAIVIAGFLVGILGIAIEIGLGSAVVRFIGNLF